ncbi:MAG: hypothetical protein LQ349_007755 [Xanthoria aureola]|nr:MAG: hypothetical protein LQ349_007755 [Xanthoria aureola]
MKHETLLSILAISAISAISQAAPARKPSRDPLRTLYNREVPQEHSHNTFLASVRTSLALNNPDNIQDPVFGLLGNGAAAAGQGSITDTNCLHQATADQAFTNAKAAGDVDGMTNALIYAALERNTGKVGLASVLCTAIKATNPEIAAISQHQDPASPGAAATNKAITLELAKQIASVGGDPQAALKSGKFAPGEVDDPTAKGNSCNTLDDEPGCIFTQNLLVEDATAQEIDAAVAGAEAPAASSGTSSAEVPIGTGSASLNAEDMMSEDAPFSNKTASATSSSDVQVETCKEQKLRRRKRQAALDFGSCSDPTIKFADGLDGRKEASFAPNSDADFNHGSALNIGVISGFICQQLNDKCKAGADAVAACKKGKEAAANAKGQDAADAFNAALGGNGGEAVQEEEEEDVTCDDSASATTSASSAAAVSSTDTMASDTDETDDDEKATPSSAAANANDNSPSTETPQSTNIQTFTGTLGGPPPPILETAGAEKPFRITAANGKTDTFIGKGTALSRSCAVQHNACADAVNRGSIGGGVGRCDEQERECNAVARA